MRQSGSTCRGLGIGDVARLCGIPPYTLRYWEREFGRFLRPRRTCGGQRRYSNADIEKVRRLRKLLHHDRFSIEGAKRIVCGNPRPAGEVLRPWRTAAGPAYSLIAEVIELVHRRIVRMKPAA